MRTLYGFVTLIERLVTWIAAAFMFAIMAIVTTDVVMRYAFNSPLSWAYELISLYLMAGVFFLVLSHAYGAGAHVSVDILQRELPDRPYHLTEVITTAASLAVFLLIAWFGYWRAVESFQSGDVMAGAIPWPTWPALALVPVGCGLIALRLVIHLLSHLSSLLLGRALVALPRHGHGPGESFE